MRRLELICGNCQEKIFLDLDDGEYDHYLRTGRLIEGSEAFQELFNGLGWVLNNTYCDVCKYDNSDVYGD